MELASPQWSPDHAFPLAFACVSAAATYKSEATLHSPPLLQHQERRQAKQSLFFNEPKSRSTPPASTNLVDLLSDPNSVSIHAQGHFGRPTITTTRHLPALSAATDTPGAAPCRTVL
ncbi:hypothetical protein LIA77_06921 [Sarocladium implicatum]|nr:hypothetical protein LIA77_06921 [Sarocladium implicatum]